MTYRLAKTNDKEAVRRLHEIILPNDFVDLRGQLWLCWNSDIELPIGFCIARLQGNGTIFLSRAGVLPGDTGNGLQRRMIRARVQWAIEGGGWRIVTYATYDNHASICNLLRSGFRFYNPLSRWGGPDVHYFRRDV